MRSILDRLPFYCHGMVCQLNNLNVLWGSKARVQFGTAPCQQKAPYQKGKYDCLGYDVIHADITFKTKIIIFYKDNYF